MQNLFSSLYLLWGSRFTFSFLFSLLFLIFLIILSYNPCVQGWLSLDHSKETALLCRKPPLPRSRSSMNGLAPGIPQTPCCLVGEGAAPSWLLPFAGWRGFLHWSRWGTPAEGHPLSWTNRSPPALLLFCLGGILTYSPGVTIPQMGALPQTIQI